MGTHTLPDIYTLRPAALVLLVYIRQTTYVTTITHMCMYCLHVAMGDRQRKRPLDNCIRSLRSSPFPLTSDNPTKPKVQCKHHDFVLL